MTTLNRKLRRREERRAAVCRRMATPRGRRHVCPLIDLLAEYGAISGNLPYPSQETLAREAGVHVRTVQRWLAILEHELRLIEVYRTRPTKDRATGRYSRRQTNRYLMCDQRAYQAPRTCPVPRRRSGSAHGPADVDEGGGVVEDLAAALRPPPAEIRRLSPVVPSMDDGRDEPRHRGWLPRIAAIRQDLKST